MTRASTVPPRPKARDERLQLAELFYFLFTGQPDEFDGQKTSVF